MSFRLVEPRAFVKLCCFWLCIIYSPIITAQLLVPGDVVVVGYNFKDPDEFAMLTLVDLQAGTQFHITDAGWDNTTQSFRKGEGVITYTVPIGGLKAGQQIVYPYDPGFSVQGINGFWGLALAGDQLLLFQGSITSPQFIFGLSDFNGFWQGNQLSLDNQTSHLPTGLQSGYTALSLNHYLQAHIQCFLFNDKNQFLSALVNPLNWVKEPQRTVLPLVDCDFSTLPLLHYDWTYEPSHKVQHEIHLKCISTSLSNPLQIRWWVYEEDGSSFELPCTKNSETSYTCTLPPLRYDFLIRPCIEQEEEVVCGMYREVLLLHPKNIVSVKALIEGGLEVSWGKKSQVVQYSLVDLTGKEVCNGQLKEVDRLVTGPLRAGYYMLSLIIDEDMNFLKVFITE